MSEATNAVNRAYHQKHDYAVAYRGDPYSDWEDLIIHRKKHPQTREKLTLAQIAQLLCRSLDGIESRRKWMKKNPKHISGILFSPDDHFVKMDEAYTNFIKGRDHANILTIS